MSEPKPDPFQAPITSPPPPLEKAAEGGLIDKAHGSAFMCREGPGIHPWIDGIEPHTRD